VTLSELLDQLGRCHTALSERVEDRFRSFHRRLSASRFRGSPPRKVSRDQVRQSLAGIGAHVVTYDDLVRGALDNCAQYLAAHAGVSQLAGLIDRLENSRSRPTMSPGQSPRGEPIGWRAEARNADWPRSYALPGDQHFALAVASTPPSLSLALRLPEC
jgi:hypothetical protein